MTRISDRIYEFASFQFEGEPTTSVIQELTAVNIMILQTLAEQDASEEQQEVMVSELFDFFSRHYRVLTPSIPPIDD